MWNVLIVLIPRYDSRLARSYRQYEIDQELMYESDCRNRLLNYATYANDERIRLFTCQTICTSKHVYICMECY